LYFPLQNPLPGPSSDAEGDDPAPIWGLGFASTNSMQQVRLVAAAPPLAPASVSLNTSVLYVGQAIGSATGGLLFRTRIVAQHGICRGGLRRSRRGTGPADPANCDRPMAAS
jgi:hypothetical protein